MDKYFAVLGDRSGCWTSSPLSKAYVFEAEDDYEARNIICSFCLKHHAHVVVLLGRITSGIRIQEVQISNKNHLDIIEYTDQRQKEIGFEHLGFEQVFVGEHMLSQLQPFSSEERRNRLKEIRVAKDKHEADMARVAMMPLPKINDDIYIPSAFYISRARDDRVGGLAKVNSITKNAVGDHFVTVEEVDGSFNWEQLALKQDELRLAFGNNRAYPHPDNSAESNEP